MKRGHAIQDDSNYAMLVLRHRLFPLANIGSQLAPMLFIGGFLLGLTNLIGVGIVLFAGAVLFQVVTLPVEFDASRRAKNKLLDLGMISNREEKGIGKVLNSAALTYVASTLMAILQLVKFIIKVGVSSSFKRYYLFSNNLLDEKVKAFFSREQFRR